MSSLKNDEVMLKLQQLSKVTGHPIEALLRAFNIRKEKHLREGITDEETRNEMAYNWIEARLRKALVYGEGTVEFDVIFLGASRVIDLFANLRNKALDAYNKDPNMAVMNRLVDAEGNPLFPPGHSREGQIIPKPPDSLMRMFYGIARKEIDGHEVKKPFVLTIRGKHAEATKVEYFKPYKIRARENSAPDAPFFDLRATNFVYQKVSDDVVNFKSFYKDYNFVPLAEIHSWHEKNRDSFGRWFITEIDIDGIVNPDTTSANYIVIADDWENPPDTLMRVFLPKEIYNPEKYSKGSRLILIGSTMELSQPDGSTEVAIIGYNIYPLVVYSAPQGSVEKVENVAETSLPKPAENNVEKVWE